MDRHDIERLRRSIVMLSPGAMAIGREDAERLLTRLGELERLVDELRRLIEDLDAE